MFWPVPKHCEQLLARIPEQKRLQSAKGNYLMVCIECDGEWPTALAIMLLSNWCAYVHQHRCENLNLRTHAHTRTCLQVFILMHKHTRGCTH